MSILSSEKVALLLANEEERQRIQTRLAVLEEQDKKILERAASKEYIDVSMFPNETGRLLTEFLKSPKRILSHEEIRQDVMLLSPEEEETDVNGCALRQVIGRARKNIKKHPDFHYEIKNIRGKGYQLVPKVVRKEVLLRAAHFTEKQEENAEK